MLKANQSQVIQSANMQMVNLRNAEIDYFSTFFSSFGTQAALISSICVNSVSQVPGLGCPCNPFWTYLYWVTTALCLVSSMHVLLCTVYISVYGQGLALRGPLGSMARAVDGMIIEQEQVVTTFCFSLFCLALSLIGTYGIMMTFTAAVLTSCMTVVGMMVWYHYSLRIYNRFYFEAKRDWNTEEDALDQHFPDPDEYSRGVQAKMHDQNPPTQGKKKGSVFGVTFKSNTKQATSASGTVVSPMSNDGSVSGATSNADATDDGKDKSGVGAQGATELFQGYLSMQESSLLSKSWVRRFVVLKGSYMVYYNNKAEFETRPQQPINKRAINFEGFEVSVEITETSYRILLSPGDDEESLKAWEFRCDTQAEMDMWRNAFERAAARAEVQYSVDSVPVRSGKSQYGGTQAM